MKGERRNKHAYLIMAHHRPDLLKELLWALDDERNDIFLHIDKKAGRELSPKQFRTENSRLFVLPRRNVNWGGYSQIRCAMQLLEKAVQNGPYAYYHLMTGASYPLCSQDRVHAFFREHEGAEVLSIGPNAPEERVRYKWPFNELGKPSNRNRWRRNIRERSVKVQKALGVDCFKQYHREVKKGFAYWSITDAAARYLVERKKRIRQMMRWSVCGDEIFVQTLLWNSPFRERIYNFEDRDKVGLWISTWPIEVAGGRREGHNFQAEDLPMLLNAEALFALKFEGEDGPGLIEEIKKNCTQRGERE